MRTTKAVHAITPRIRMRCVQSWIFCHVRGTKAFTMDGQHFKGSKGQNREAGASLPKKLRDDSGGASTSALEGGWVFPATLLSINSASRGEAVGGLAYGT